MTVPGVDQALGTSIWKLRVTKDRVFVSMVTAYLWLHGSVPMETEIWHSYCLFSSDYYQWWLKQRLTLEATSCHLLEPLNKVVWSPFYIRLSGWSLRLQVVGVKNRSQSMVTPQSQEVYGEVADCCCGFFCRGVEHLHMFIIVITKSDAALIRVWKLMFHVWTWTG